MVSPLASHGADGARISEPAMDRPSHPAVRGSPTPHNVPTCCARVSDPAQCADRRSPRIAERLATSGDLRSDHAARSGDLRRARRRPPPSAYLAYLGAAVRGSPTPHNVPTEGLPESPSGLPLQETCGRTMRRGQETSAEQRGNLRQLSLPRLPRSCCARVSDPAQCADRRSPRIAERLTTSGDLRSDHAARSGDLRRAQRGNRRRALDLAYLGAAVRGSPTPHNVPTEGLPESPSGLPLQETCGRTMRRGQETSAERGETSAERLPRLPRSCCARVSDPAQCADRRSPRIAERLTTSGDLRSDHAARSGDLRRARGNLRRAPTSLTSELLCAGLRPRTMCRPKVSQNRRAAYHFRRPAVGPCGEVRRPPPSARRPPPSAGDRCAGLCCARVSDPAQCADRRSPGIAERLTTSGDLRSDHAARSGDLRRARGNLRRALTSLTSELLCAGLRPRTMCRPKVSQNRRAACHFRRPAVGPCGEVRRPPPSARRPPPSARRPPPSPQETSAGRDVPKCWLAVRLPTTYASRQLL